VGTGGNSRALRAPEPSGFLTLMTMLELGSPAAACLASGCKIATAFFCVGSGDGPTLLLLVLPGVGLVRNA